MPTRAKTARKPSAKKPLKRSTNRKASNTKAAVIKRLARAKIGSGPLDLSALPSESVGKLEKCICLACVLDVFTRHMGLTPKAAHLEIKRYTPSVAELYASAMTRPYFAGQSPKDRCPYCGSAPKWHARLQVYRIESGKATDVLRRELVKSLPKSDDQFLVLEEKGTQQHAFFEWLDKISASQNLDNPDWLREVSRHYLSRKEPKADWQAAFDQIHSIRRSRRLESGWEVDHGRLFLSPMLFDELLLVQYLVSRSHKAGGQTLEGRYTLLELFVRLRSSGYLRAVAVHAHNPGDALEELLNHLSGGQTSLKLYHIVDRRDFVAKVKALRLLKPPKPKKPGVLVLAKTGLTSHHSELHQLLLEFPVSADQAVRRTVVAERGLCLALEFGDNALREHLPKLATPH